MGYVGMGETSNSNFQDFWEYDRATDTWTQKADFGGGTRLCVVGFSIGNKGYVGTGIPNSNDNDAQKDFWEYNPVTNTWTRKADFGGTARYSAAGASIGGKGYIGIGYAGLNRFNDFWEYDPATDTWTQKANIGGNGGEATAINIGNKIYASTYIWDEHPNYNNLWEYDPTTDTWTQKSDIGWGEVRLGSAFFSIGNKGYAGLGVGAGSDNNNVLYNDFWEYDPVTDTWTKKVDFGGIARFSVVSFSIGTRGYVGLGIDSSSYFNDFWEYGSGSCTTPPVISSLTASPASIWPPNNKMVSVTVRAVVSDPCDSSPVTKIISVSSNEPANSDAVANGEAVITGNMTLKLLAQRNGNGNGRIYTITVQCTDSAGNITTGTVTVVVPHDQGK